MSYVRKAGLDRISDLKEAYLTVGLTSDQCIELCDIGERTWYRWLAEGAPKWAIRLIMSQQGTLDRFGWKHWEIRSGALYCNDLHHCYFWEPVHLIMPLYNVNRSHLPMAGHADNLASIEDAMRDRDAREAAGDVPLQQYRHTHDCA